MDVDSIVTRTGWVCGLEIKDGSKWNLKDSDRKLEKNNWQHKVQINRRVYQYVSKGNTSCLDFYCVLQFYLSSNPWIPFLSPTSHQDSSRNFLLHTSSDLLWKHYDTSLSSPCTTTGCLCHDPLLLPKPSYTAQRDPDLGPRTEAYGHT